MKPMKLCLDPICRRKDQLLPLTEFHVSRRLKDGRTIYCGECCVRQERENEKRRQHNRKLRNQTKVKESIARGRDTREAIQRSTHLPYDEIGDALVDLLWDSKAVRIKRAQGEAVFCLAA